VGVGNVRNAECHARASLTKPYDNCLKAGGWLKAKKCEGRRAQHAAPSKRYVG
jgi:hypothetical protein